MLSTFKKIYSLLTPAERRRGLTLLIMTILMGFLDMVGVAAILPFMTAVASPNAISQNPYLSSIKHFLGIESPSRFLFILGLCVLMLLILSISFKALTTYAIVRFTSMRNFQLSSRLVTGYLLQPYEWFLNRNSSDLSKTILSEVDQVIRGAMLPLAQLLTGASTSCFIIILLIIADPLLAGAVTLTLGTAYLLLYLFLRPRLKKTGQARVASSRLKYQIVSEAFGGIKEIKLGGLERTFVQRFSEPALQYASAEASNALSAQLPKYVLETLAFGGMMFMTLFLIGTKGSIEQVLPTMALYGFAGYRLLPTLQQIYQSAVTMRFAEAAIDSLRRDFAEKPSPPPMRKADISGKSFSPQDVQFRNVSFCYPGGSRLALDNLSFTIPAKAKIGIVGQTGSGKTTLVDIFLGLLRPTSGDILIGSQLFSGSAVREWQDSLGYVSQSIFLADDTIAANIAFGTPACEIDQSAVELAAKTANLHDFVMNDLPNGYETMIGERGVRLSGGQRQRIGIARALYRKPSFLVLDEATSALDNLTESNVMRAVEDLSSDLTIIIIAHRLDTVKRCDTILLLDTGKLIASGSYEQLIAGSPAFRELAKARSHSHANQA